jgi:predicted kinase
MDLVVLAGLQGAGKTSFYRARFGETHAHVSKDNFRSNPNKSRRQRELVLEAVRSGLSAVVDNTNVRREDRLELVAFARELGLRPVLYWFPPEPKASLARNAGREGKARVPRSAIFLTLKRLVPPDASEGFESVYEVVAREGGGFEVTSRPELARGAAPLTPAPGPGRSA